VSYFWCVSIYADMHTYTMDCMFVLCCAVYCGIIIIEYIITRFILFGSFFFSINPFSFLVSLFAPFSYFFFLFFRRQLDTVTKPLCFVFWVGTHFNLRFTTVYCLLLFLLFISLWVWSLLHPWG